MEVMLEMEKRFQRGYKERIARIWRMIGYLGTKTRCRCVSEVTNLDDRMTVLLPEQEAQRKRDNCATRPLVWLWPWTPGLYRELGQAQNQYKHSNYKSELLMRYWSGIVLMGLKLKSFLIWKKTSLRKTMMDGEGLENLTGGEMLLSAFGKALMEAWGGRQRAQHGSMPVGIEVSLLYWCDRR